MPTISMFYGIILRMYCAPKEHNSPHIHVYELRKEELMADWTLAQNGELPFKIDPLR